VHEAIAFVPPSPLAVFLSPVHTFLKVKCLYAAMPMTPKSSQYKIQLKLVWMILTTGRASTSVTSLLGLLVTTLTEIISSGVDDNSTLRKSVEAYENLFKWTYADNALGADQLDELISGGALAIALTIGLEVAKVTNMASLISWCTVCLAVGVDYSMLHQPGSRYEHSITTHSGGQRRCSRWCCHQIGGRACHAQHWGRFQWYPMWWWLGRTLIPART
jgi:hypothetical protein